MVIVDNASKTYKAFLRKKKTVHAVRSLSFEVAKGEVFGLLGPNGAGKTSTVKMICALLKPNAGHISIDGMDVNKHRKAILRKIGVVLEGSRTSHWPLTVRENLRYYGNLKDVRGSRLKNTIERLLEFIDLRDKGDTPVKKLSRGMKQKLAICIALVADPDVLILDEPTTGLDVATSMAIKEKVCELTREQGKTVIITTHDMAVAQQICDRIAILSEGKLVAMDRTENLIKYFSGHTYEISLASDSGGADYSSLESLASVKKLSSITRNGELVLELDLENPDALYEIMARLKELDAPLLSVTKREASLEDVFLRLTSGKPDPKGEE